MSTWGGNPPYGNSPYENPRYSQGAQLGHYGGDQRKIAQTQYGGGGGRARPSATNGVGTPMLVAVFIVVASLVGGGVYLFAFGGLDAINGVAPVSTSAPTPPTLKPTPLPTLVRAPSSPYVVVTFTSPPTTPVAAVNAFDSAAARWSTILAGTEVNSGTVLATDTFNDFGCGLTNDAGIPVTNIDQLHIAADIALIDGVGQVLGRAGPCSGFLESIDKPGTLLPVLGQMTFDSADLTNLVNAGTLEDVILHEMGHVLGLGTLWSGSDTLGIPALVEDEVFPFGQPIQAFNSPRYVGHGARAEFQSLSSSTGDVPVEDGSFQGLSPAQLASGIGRGSVDGHWRETVFQTELMTPAIGGTNNPMSLMTLRSLEDIGYAVDTSQADAYSIPSSSVSSARTSLNGESTVLHGDIFRCPTLQNGLDKARNRIRMQKRLGGGKGLSLHDG